MATNFPSGVSSFGVPVIGSGAQIPVTSGSYFFVSSVSGNVGNSGKTPQAALATVQSAISKCTAAKGDVIVLLPGHAETVTATNFLINKSGVSIVGLGTGALRPTFTFSSDVTIAVSAANCTLSGCIFSANFADVASAITVGAAKNFQLLYCDFTETGTDLNWFASVTTGSTNNAADGLTVIGCYSLYIDAAAKAFISVLGNLDRLLVTDNIHITGATGDAGQFLTCSSKVLLGARVLRNYLQIVGANSGATVGLFQTGSSTTSTGMMAFNLVNSIDTTGALFNTTGQGFGLQENYVSGAVDKQGTLHPAADNPA